LDNPNTRSFPKSSQALGLVFILVAVLALLFISVPSHTFLWKAVNDFAHLPLFGIVAILLLSMSRMGFTTLGWSPLRHYGVAMVGALVLALLTEGLQSFSATRQAEMSDIVRDLVGATCGLALFFTYDRELSGIWGKWRQFPRNAILRFSVVVLLGVTLQPVWGWAYAYWDRASRFPSLLQFSSSWEMKFVKASNSTLQVVVPPAGWKKSVEDTVGHVLFYPKKYPGLCIDEPYPDWQGYTSLQIEVFSELPAPQLIVIRIDDLYHNNEHSDRFNKAINIVPGLNQSNIPLDDIRQAPVGREFDLRAIKTLLLFAVNPPKAFSLYQDNFRLK
jgi:hypothetical protein